jgi:hypothetical protein
MFTLNIITPCGRPENLVKIKDDLNRFSDDIIICWYIVYDGKFNMNNLKIFEEFEPIMIYMAKSPYKNAVGGHLHRNFAIEFFHIHQDEYVYFLDDDNLISEDIINFTIDNKLDKDVYLFSQLRNGNTIIADKDAVKVGVIDTAQVLFKRKCLNDYKFENVYDADGRFIMYLYEKYEFNFCQDVFSFYNKLKQQTI